MQIVILLLIGAVMGLLSGLVGIGGGVVAVPAMMYFLKMPASVAMGTSLALIVPIALSGATKQFLQQNVDLKSAVLIAVSGIVFAYVGAYLNARLPDVVLRRIFGALVIVIGFKMLMSTGAAKPSAVADAVPTATTPSIEAAVSAETESARNDASAAVETK